MPPEYKVEQFDKDEFDGPRWREWVEERQRLGWRIIGAVSSNDSLYIYVVAELPFHDD